jgi:hypothetical protein
MIPIRQKPSVKHKVPVLVVVPVVRPRCPMTPSVAEPLQIWQRLSLAGKKQPDALDRTVGVRKRERRYSYAEQIGESVFS